MPSPISNAGGAEIKTRKSGFVGHDRFRGYGTTRCSKASIIDGLKIAESEARNIAEMVSESRCCSDILIRTSDVVGMLHAAATGIVQNHIAACVVRLLQEEDRGTRQRGMDELMKTIATLLPFAGR